MKFEDISKKKFSLFSMQPSVSSSRCVICAPYQTLLCVLQKKRRYSCLPQVPPAKCVLPVGHAISVKKNVNCETGEWSHKAKEPGEMGETARIQKLLPTLISDQTVQHSNLFLRLHILNTQCIWKLMNIVIHVHSQMIQEVTISQSL